MTRIAFGLVALASLAAPASADTWTIDPSHSAATFSVRHMMVANVRGEFGTLSGTISFDPKDLTKTVAEATIEAASVNTRDAKRDGHLKSPDFFDVAKFPSITFKSKRAEKAGGKLKLTGDLTIRGVTREVVLDVDGPSPELKDPYGNTKVGASATTKINRTDFGLKWNVPLANGVLVGDEVNIVLDLELLKTTAAPPAKK